MANRPIGDHQCHPVCVKYKQHVLVSERPLCLPSPPKGAWARWETARGGGTGGTGPRSGWTGIRHNPSSVRGP
ncbi:GL10066 [Drosophila persimilis]|uniref:GL10066 n=1 Tax=Drosophila persimilis TaxID=7234 RepID=B4IRG5_DROPE|nr:GL10066 [Drosophila persimilis]